MLKLPLAAGLAGLPTSALLAQSQPSKGAFGDYKADAESLPEDKDVVWTLSFRFKLPRITTADVPGRGKRVVWYMWYQVFNQTAEPRSFFPKFELVTIDKKTKHLDQILPSVQKEIAATIDPTDRLKIHNSITIGEQPVPVSKKEAFPTAVTGVAIWPDVYERARDTNQFTVFVSGLSDGWVLEGKTLKRKTLQLGFIRQGDERVESSSIELKSQKWIYRSAETLDEADLPTAPKKD
jgi:hypothetical protein